MDIKEKIDRDSRRKELRQNPEVQQWLKHMIRNINETEVKVTVEQFNKINRAKQKSLEPKKFFSFTVGAYDDRGYRRTAKKKH